MSGASSMSRRNRQGRGCVFFNFGSAHALNLLVSIHSLRKVHDGPILVFLEPDEYGDSLKNDVEALGADVEFLAGLSRSFDRHRIIDESPFTTTLAFDSDILFQGPIDTLWEPLEREGVLVTRFFPPPYGIDRKPGEHGRISRMELLDGLKGLLDAEILARAAHRLVHDRIDINVGVLGVSRPLGDEFLAAWSKYMEIGRDQKVLLLDEMLVVALIDRYPHFLADEIWNCPADEYFRRTNLSDAVAIHYFADGVHLFNDRRLGRNPQTWAGRKWYEAYFETAGVIDLTRWRILDPRFDRSVEPVFAGPPGAALRNGLRDVERGIRSVRNRLLDRSYWNRFR